jgi:cellulose synthase (UDP-forming)
MSVTRLDPRLDPPAWDPEVDDQALRTKVRLLTVANIAVSVWYFAWLLRPANAGHPGLYGVLVLAELFNLAQAVGFWWTCAHQRVRGHLPPPPNARVDVFIPVYNEPIAIVEPTVAAAVSLRGAAVRVYLLDDGPNPQMRALAVRYGANYMARLGHAGAKAGNINRALVRTTGEYVAVFDADHVADAGFFEQTLGHFADEQVAFVQTPQYYANGRGGGVASASWAQQALFFGAIARGKDGLGAMFCCGTNVVFRRLAIESVGGFPEESVTEDFQLSIRLHERGWKSVYVSKVLARGLAPEDMASYVRQQQRWACGCLAALPAAVHAALPWQLKLQYVLSSMFFLSGWTLMIYMLLPVIAILSGASPVDVETADQFLMHFGPYWSLALLNVTVAGGGSYTFSAFTLLSVNFWVYVFASLKVALRRPGGFVVTPKAGTDKRQPRAVAPALVAIAVLTGTTVYGVTSHPSPALLNNAAFALLHISVLAVGVWPALQRGRQARTELPTKETVRKTIA